MRKYMWTGLIAITFVYCGCGKKKKEKAAQPSCERMLEMNKKCINTWSPTAAVKPERAFRVCMMAQKSVPLVQRQVRCSAETKCEKYEKCFNPKDEVSKKTWKLLFKYDKEKKIDGKDYDRQADICIEWKEDKLGVLKHLCKDPMKAYWPKLVAQAEKDLKEGWENSGDADGRQLYGLGAYLGHKEKGAALKKALAIKDKIWRAKSKVDERLQYYKKFGSGVFIVKGCTKKKFDEFYDKCKHPAVKKLTKKLAHHCYVKLGAVTLELDMRKGRSFCSTREEIVDMVKRFSLKKDAKLEEMLKKTAKKCK